MSRSLPPARTRFVGRKAERAEVRALLQGKDARLVTLLGPPGTGKTRLALEVARDLETVSDVWLCDLSAARSAADAALTLAHVLGVGLPERSDLKSATAALTRALSVLGDKLLLLDNLEQLVPDIRVIVESCLDAGAHVSVLATSRERIDVAGERCVALPPLPEEDAATLFRDRARAAGVDLEDDPGGVVRALVTRLDGIPLAIELAAARARVLSPRRLLERLEERLQLLGGSPATLPSLDEAIRLSWDRLSPFEQRALSRASVFAGGFSLDAAEAVLHDGAVVVDVLQALVDRSLLTTTSGQDGDVRFRLLENIRAFAAERLSQLGLEEEARERHALWLADESERRVLPLRVSPPSDVLAWLQSERDNLLAVVRRPPSSSNGQRAVIRAALALHLLLRERGPAEVHLEVLQRASELAGALQDERLILRVRAASTIARRDERGWQGSLDELSKVLVEAKALGLRALEAEAHRASGEMLFQQGQHAAAIERFQAATAIYDDEGAREGAAQLKTLLGPALIADGRRDEAERLLLEAVADAEALDLPRVGARAEYRLGLLAHQRGELEAASSRYEAALDRLGATSGDLTLEAGLKHKLAVLHHEREELEAALALFEEAVSLYETAGSAWYVGASLALLGAVKADLGDVDDAGRVARRGESLLSAAGPPSSGFASAWVGAIECRRKQRTAARAAFERAHAALDETGDAFDRALLEILEGHLTVLDGQQAASDVLERVRPRAELGVSPRYALRFLERSLRGDDDSQVAPASSAVSALEVAADARWFRLANGAPVDVAKKRVLRRLLAVLVERRLTSPGHVVSRAELLDAGWPGERMRADSALSRLYVSVASLRRLGLEDVLMTAGDGYLLDPAVVVTRVATQAAG